MIARLAAVVAVVAACAGAVLMSAAGGEEGATGKRYKIVFDNGFGLTHGGEVKIGGVNAGAIRDFELSDGPPHKVVVEVEVSEPGFDAMRTDARCAVRQQSLIGEYFIECQLGRLGRPLPDGGTVPVKQTSSTIPLDLINNVQRRPYRERFRIILSELGAGLAGRPAELNEVIRRAHPGLRETSQTVEILARQNRIIRNFIVNADRFSAGVEPRKEELARWAKEASETATIQASRRESLQRQWNRLPVFLGELQPTLARLEAAADEQIPLLRRLRPAAPRLRAFLAQLGPFAQSARGSTRALGETANTGREALRVSADEVAQLRELSEDAPELAKPLRQFLQTLDDRGRSIEEDPEARGTAPPPPDKTAYKPGQGYTGMESLLNYFYWQPLAINAFDEVSHMLRIAPFQNQCSPFSSDPTPAQVKTCGSLLGPRQPGINAPDPTDGPALGPDGRSRRASGNSAADRRDRERRRGPGEPEAPPTPGKPDPSRPMIVLPPEIQEMIDGLENMPRPSAGEAPPPARPDDLLDFLLAP